MTALFQDLRHAIRSLCRSPGFTFTVIATLGIGIGLNAAIFTVVDCVLLRPLGYHDADRILSIQTHFIDENRSIARIGGDDFVDLAHQVKGLEAVAHYQGGWPDGISVKGEALYGVTAYSVAQRRFEFGLRIALGANRAQVLAMVLGKAAAYAAVGIGIGIALSLGLVRVLASVVGKLPAFDAAAYLIASLAVLTIATLATLLPARAAANANPMSVLRSE